MSPWLRNGRPTASSIAKPPATHQWQSKLENIAASSLRGAGSHLPKGAWMRVMPFILRG